MPVPDKTHQGPRGTPVWVRLDALMPRIPGQPIRTDGSGIDMTGEAAGTLIRWQPTYKGDWMALVDYEVPRAEPGRPPIQLTMQLLPGYALRQRE